MSNTFDWKNKTWYILDSFFKNKSIFVAHHIESFNAFIKNDIAAIIEENNPLKIQFSYNQESCKYLEEYIVKFGEIYISKPVINESDGTIKQMFPNDARLRNLTYASNLYIDVRHYYRKYNTKNDEYEEVEFPPVLKKSFGKLPIMLRSDFCVLSEQTNKTRSEMGECEYDEGGYFIINGVEKVVVCQETLCNNKVYLFPGSKTTIQKYSHITTVTSVPYNKRGTIKNTKVMLTAKEVGFGKTIKVTINRVKTELPLFIVFRALGVISDKKICEYILHDITSEKNKPLLDMLEASIEEASVIENQKIAIEYISNFVSVYMPWKKNIQDPNKYKLMYTKEIIMKEFLPHIGTNLTKKAYFLGYMTNKLLMNVAGYTKPDDRDSFINKRILTSGELMAILFRENYNKVIRDLKTGLEKEIHHGRLNELKNNLAKRIKGGSLDNYIKKALATGDWGIKSMQSMKGVAQLLQRINYLATLSLCRRVISPVPRDVKVTELRKLHNTQYGYMCPSETPEGESIGITKNLALSAYITNSMNIEPVLKVFNENGVIILENVTPFEVSRNTKVFLNGDWIGIHKSSNELHKKLVELRRSGILHPYTSICWDFKQSEIHVYTDGGRLTRPLYIVENNKTLITNEIGNKICRNELQFSDLIIKEKMVEYIDTQESNCIMIAMANEDLERNKNNENYYLKYTHMELHPSMMYGVLVSNIPYSNHNQGPRNIYQGVMGKQALGLYATNFRRRMDTDAHVLQYPQKPIVTTKPSIYVNSNAIPSGINVMVAIACYTGYNQEDSLIFNQSSIDRGLFASTSFKTYKEEEKRNSSTLEDEKFCKPEKYYPNKTLKTLGIKGGTYDKLNDDGFAIENKYVNAGDIVIGKIMPIKGAEPGKPKYKDVSKEIKKNEKGYVDWVYVNRNDGSYRVCKVRIRNDRYPTVGDKFSSRHGQKGTIGITYPEEDMPFNKDGIKPDIIMNPLAFPGRMSIGHLIEGIGGKIGAMLGREMDGTPFTNVSVDDLGEILQTKCGFSKTGKEVFYSGKTGEMMKCDIFIGPTFYYRLKHMVIDKIHSRQNGPYQLLTRQPAEGRSRDGGHKIGEMERDALLAHGTVQFLKERWFDSSDKYQFYLCKKTGMIAVANPEKNIFRSLYDKTNNTEFAKVQVPYASKLFLHELMSMGIAPRMFT